MSGNVSGKTLLDIVMGRRPNCFTTVEGVDHVRFDKLVIRGHAATLSWRGGVVAEIALNADVTETVVLELAGPGGLVAVRP